MILINKIKLSTFGNRKLDYYKELGYDVSSDDFIIDIRHLNSGSRFIVPVKCDFCSKEVNITYKEYLRNISIGGEYACCKICGSEKAKKANMKKYGVDYPLMLLEIQDKQKLTNMERYGVEYLMQSDLMRDKSKKTCLAKYGVEHISKTDSFKEKCKETNILNSGVDYPMQSLDIIEKSMKTLMKKYGVDNPSKSPEIQNIIKMNNLERHGVDHTSKLDSVKKKLKNTCLGKYGFDNITKNKEFREKFIICKNENYLEYINDGKSLFNCDLGKNHTFELSSDIFHKRIECNLPICTVCYPVADLKSIKEKELSSFIKSIYDDDVILSYRDGLEIDIYLPKLSIGFEFNGLYWHSDVYKNNKYHLNKTDFFNKKGIRIIHIWEDDWIFKNEIVKSQIKNLLCKTPNKIFARKCDVREVNKIESKDFLNKSHIQGNTTSSKKYGLFFNNELVSLMTFDHFEGRKKMDDSEWNLNRFCNKLEYNIIGGASKLLNHFVKNEEVSRMVSYADKDWSSGNLYFKLGFIKINDTNPDYKYIIDGKRIHKSKYRKSNLDTYLSESDEMKNRNINKIWDCGKMKFEKKFFNENINL